MTRQGAVIRTAVRDEHRTLVRERRTSSALTATCPRCGVSAPVGLLTGVIGVHGRPGDPCPGSGMGVREASRERDAARQGRAGDASAHTGVLTAASER